MTSVEEEAMERIEATIQIVGGIVILTICLYALDDWLIDKYKIRAQWHLSMLTFYSALLLFFLGRIVRDNFLD